MTKYDKVSQSVCKSIRKVVWWVGGGGGGGTVIITYAPGPGESHSQRFSEILRDSLSYGMVWTWTGA